ncbi:MAG TPA: response regulator transcription factor [Woeseiaceae bacterium]|nr:response regulator transcription factor [Woeseiaceae bacterium]
MQLRLVMTYGIAMAAGALLLDWLEVQFYFRRFSTEIYVVILCGLFTGLGAWIGHRLTRQAPQRPFQINTRALNYLGISDREREVLALLGAGHSNREIADRLFISTNTVKTHVSNLYQKLEVSRRGQAVRKARSLQLVP